MRIMTITGSKCTATLTPQRAAKRVVLAGRFALGANVADHFRKLGWEVHTVNADHDVHATAAETDPHAVLLPENTGEESGYLACVKLRQTLPDLKVVVVGSERTAGREKFAEFVGAKFVTEADGVGRFVTAMS
ncbi:hypothetical protein VT84_31675 [Gemmata sp. SH-PL17]|uniref:hypothetical protein n=1 Tax=Gemmata sp. SH-PL17 TaxID=1630693 RepID=UPI00078CBB4E|nr:hypothetical protein [Gemmata sp. SH-PL17]AMV28997.1 hypothetical protein VT84_31675 [Gemmata sp. SH-PL17]